MKNNKERQINIKNLMLIIFCVLIASIFIVFIFLNVETIIGFFANIITILKAIIYGLIMTYIMSPLYNLIVKKLTIDDNKKNKSKNNTFAKGVATAACVVSVIIIVIGLIALVLPQLIISIYNFALDFVNYQDKISDFINSEEGLTLMEKIPLIEQMTAYSRDLVSNLSKLFTTDLLPKINDIAVHFSMGALKTFKEVLNFLIGIIVMIYVLNMKTNMLNAFKKCFYALFSTKVADKILEECRFAHKVFSGFIVGKLLDSLIIGILCFICCYIMKMPYVLLVSVIVGVTNIIPFFGPFIGAIPSFIFIVLVNPIKGLIFLVFILVLQQFDGNILGPYILGDKTGVESFYVLFSILLFGGLFGFVGMIIGVPLWAVLSRLCWEFLDSRLKEKKLPLDVDKYNDK